MGIPLDGKVKPKEVKEVPSSKKADPPRAQNKEPEAQTDGEDRRDSCDTDETSQSQEERLEAHAVASFFLDEGREEIDSISTHFPANGSDATEIINVYSAFAAFATETPPFDSDDDDAEYS